MTKYQGIIIDRAHMNMLQEAINTAQGRARVRTICAEDIIDTCENVQKKLDIPQTALEGVQITVDRHAQKFPAAYNGRPESTIFQAVYSGRKWRLLKVYRGDVRRPGHGTSIVLTDTAKSVVLAAACEY